LTNVEIKIRYQKNHRTDGVLRKIGAEFDKKVIQTDTYFHVDKGWLKIRETDSSLPQLIQYFREHAEGPRSSHYEIVHLKNAEKVKQTLATEHGIRGVVKKSREIWTWKNVCIHFDCVEKLGDFLEFEAVIQRGESASDGQKKVEWLMKKFGIQNKNLEYRSYGDLLDQEISCD